MASAMNLKWQDARTHLLAITQLLLRTMIAVARMPRLDMRAMEVVCWIATAMAYAIKTRSPAARTARRAIMKPPRPMQDTVITPQSNYDCDGACLNDTDADGICDEFEAAGCTDLSAAILDASATDDDGSCTYASAGYACDGSCLMDSDSDGVCDQNEVTGCQDESVQLRRHCNGCGIL